MLVSEICALTPPLFSPPLPSPNPTLTPTCYQLTVVGLWEGWVRSCADTDIDPKLFVRILRHFDNVAGFFPVATPC